MGQREPGWDRPKPPGKPSWLSSEAWRELLQRYDGVPHCEKTGVLDDLVTDHIVPRWLGGTNDPSNLQFLTALENLRKGVRPDSHWSQGFYWDQTPNLENLRGAQRKLFAAITDDYSEWFGRPTSQIAQNLYVNAWVVGAGKTLGIVVAACAVNHVIQERWPAAPRADRVLVITKERAIRDQIADDLAKDIVGYGILPQAPRVGIVTQSWQLDQNDWLDQHDVLVTCVQQLWERERGIARTDIAKILAHFPVIAFDEPHFAADQVSRLVDLAANSVCFGFTGTPIDAAGGLLEQMVRLTVYGYDEATYLDQSLKWLSSEPGLFTDFVHEIGITEARLLERGEHTTTDDPTKDGYGKNIEPAKSVVRAVIHEMKRRDELVVASERIAFHRDERTTRKAGIYPAHPIIVCDSVDTAIRLCENTNQMVERDPEAYPPERGYGASVVYADKVDAKGKPVVGEALTPEHPWMRSKHQGWRLDRKCRRILFVVGIGREGVNNPACGPIGVAASLSSVVEHVQRAIGRQLRAVTSVRDGKLHVPPAPLDQVQIITHVTFGNAEALARAISFVCDMEDSLDSLPQIEDLESGEPRLVKELEQKLSLPMKEKIEIAGRLAVPDPDGEPVPIDEIVTEFAGFDPGGRRAKKIREWAAKVREDPAEARREIRLGSEIKPNFIVTREQVRHDPTDADLERHLRIHHASLVSRYVPIAPEHRELIATLYEEHVTRFHLPPLTSSDHIAQITIDVTHRVLNNLGRYFEGDENEVYRLAGTARNMKLGVPRGEKARNDSDWDTPQVHALLRRADVQAELAGWVMGKLLDNGSCPGLSLLRDPHGFL